MNPPSPRASIEAPVALGPVALALALPTQTVAPVALLAPWVLL